MPFSDAQFAAAWTVLEDRYNRKHNVQTVKIYRDILESELTTAEFATACRAAFRMEAFFPSPQKLIDLGIGQDFAGRALVEWDACMDRARSNEAATLPGTLTRTLMNKVTNGVPLGNVPTDRLEWHKKEFLKRYADALTLSARNALPTPTKELTYDAAD